MKGTLIIHRARSGLTAISGVLALALAIAGCGGTDSPPAPSSSSVSGVVSMDSAFSGAVTLKDSSHPEQKQASGDIDQDGAFAVDVSGLTPPYMLEAEITPDGADTTVRMHSVSDGHEAADIDPLTDAAVAGASSTSADDAFEHGDEESNHRMASGFKSVLAQLQTALKPLLDLYGVATTASKDAASRAALRALLADVSITVESGQVVVTNRETGGVIFSGALNDLSAGTFTAANMPAGPGTPPPGTSCTYTYSDWGTCSGGAQARTVTGSSPAGCTGTPVLSQVCTTPPPVLDGAALYTANCSSCHGPLATSTKLGRTAAQITAANMTRGLSPAEVQAIADALAATTPPPPAACTYTYAAWGACQSNGTQTRTVASSSPAGCAGTPVLSQACTYVPPVTTCSAFTYSAWSTCSAAGSQTRTVATSAPAGCTGGSPMLTQACTPPPPAACTYTYAAWGACQSNGTQSRTVASSSPSGCAGTPVLSQACTYVPPVTTCSAFTYSAWSTCSAAGSQTRTVATSAPAGCTGGSPVLTQACTPPPVLDGAALYGQSCSGCHGSLASSNLKGKSMSLSLIKSRNMTQGLTDAQLQAIVTAVGP